jgi:hypothetical protein
LETVQKELYLAEIESTTSEAKTQSFTIALQGTYDSMSSILL